MKKFIYILLTLLFASTAYSQQSFHRLYNVLQDSTHRLSEGTVTNGGGYATLGQSVFSNVDNSNLENAYRAIFTTYDGKGDILIKNDIYLADSSVLASTSDLVQLSNGDFVMTASLLSDDQSAAIVGLDGTTGEPSWSIRMADENQVKVSLASFEDDEIIVGSMNIEEGLSIWLAKMNGINGSDTWSKKYTAEDEDNNVVPAYIYNIHTSVLDSNVFITGRSELNDLEGYHLTKVDTMGNVLWSTHTDSTGFRFSPYSLTETLDSSVYVIGKVESNTTSMESSYVSKFTNDGNLVWSRMLSGGSSSFNIGVDIIPFGNNLVFSNLGTETTNNPTISTLFEIDSSGTIVNSQVYQDSSSLLALGNLSLAADGGIVNFGTHFEPFVSQVSDIIKTDQNLQTPCSSPGLGTLSDFPTVGQSLAWVSEDFMDSDTLETDVSIVNYYDVPTISPSAMQWCPNEQILDTLDATPSPLPEGEITYEWMGPGVDGSTTPIVVGMEEGEYMVTVTINDDQCFTLCDTVNISRLPEPMAAIDADYSQFCTEGLIILTGQFTGVLPLQSLNWSTSETEQAIAVENEGSYTFTIVDDCMETAVATETVVFPEIIAVKWPSVFFPNGEETENRVFGPYIDEECNPDISNYSLKIYNRWGNEVFTSDNIEETWNGQHGESDSASAVYVYVAEYLLNGEEKLDKGDVTLLR